MTTRTAAPDPRQDLQERSGRVLAGVFAFGDSPELSDELLGFVARGTKRATAGSLAELEAEDEPFPEPGLCWGLLDGHGAGRFVMETTEVRTGRLDSVDPAFAWDEGEYDRTYEDWLEGHRRYFGRQGAADPDALAVVFERFRIVWPEEDATIWLADGVREVGVEDRAWAAEVLRARHGAGLVTAEGMVDPVGLPALVVERAGARQALLTFRPRPGGIADVVTIDMLREDVTVDDALRKAMGRLALQAGWSRVRW